MYYLGIKKEENSGKSLLIFHSPQTLAVLEYGLTICERLFVYASNDKPDNVILIKGKK